MTVDAKELMQLNQGFEKYRNAIPPTVAKKALREAAQPMLRSARSLAPVGRVIDYKRDRIDQSRGGATRRDMRMMFVKEEGEEIARVIIGVSQKSGKVGWRTHFITKGYTDRGGGFHRGKDFLGEAHEHTIDIVQNNFYKLLFEGFVKWGQQNLPQ